MEEHVVGQRLSQKNMTSFVPSKEDLRNSLLFCYLLDKTPLQAHTMLVKAYGSHSLCKEQCIDLFDRFRKENIHLEDRGKPKKFQDNELQELLNEDNSQTQAQLGDSLSVCVKTISLRLKEMGIIKKLGLWVPQQLDEEQLKNRIICCETLLARLHREPFLDRAVIGDRKWIYLEQPKRKIMLCVWWDQHGLIYYELLPSEETVNINRYHQQIINLNNAVCEKRRQYNECDNKVVLLHCNAPSDASTVVEDTFKSLGWETYETSSPDLAPSTHLFSRMELIIGRQFFITNNQVQTWINEWFRSHGYKCHYEIHNLPDIWKSCINKQGNYVV